MSNDSRRFPVSALIGSKVKSASGKNLGRVVEIEVSPAPEYRVLRLILGGSGWLERWNVLLPVARARGRSIEPKTIDWSDVERCEPPVITLR